MKDFVPHKQSLELKKLGFDEECIGFYYKSIFAIGSCRDYPNPNKHDYLESPTFSQAFRWFREVHDLDIISRPHIGKTKKYICEPVNYRLEARNTPEEAELACLIKLIEIVKTK